MIFDVKFDGRRKARFIARGNRTNDPGDDASLGVVALVAICLGMLAAIHNHHKVTAAGIANAKTNEKLYTILPCVDEFGELSGKSLVCDKDCMA